MWLEVWGRCWHTPIPTFDASHRLNKFSPQLVHVCSTRYFFQVYERCKYTLFLPAIFLTIFSQQIFNIHQYAPSPILRFLVPLFTSVIKNCITIYQTTISCWCIIMLYSISTPPLCICSKTTGPMAYACNLLHTALYCPYIQVLTQPVCMARPYT